jgi:predicted transcriptional regulator
LRRDRKDIIADILSVTLEGACKTEIVYKTNLNFNHAGKYISYLVGKGLLGKVSGRKTRYKTTEKGIKLLEKLRAIKKLIE